MFEPLRISSHRGEYDVTFETGVPFSRPWVGTGRTHIVLDRLVGELYEDALAPMLANRSVLIIEASEEAKSLERCPGYIEALISGGVRRGDVLLAIGGGVIQDVTCFVASILLRGMDWAFYPTTLLAQADSCIGSKSSINVGSVKNIVGTFTPPQTVVINPRVLKTLPEVEVRSGIGEMLKVHAIAGPDAFDRIARDYERLSDEAVMLDYIQQSLLIKKGMIEADEFDRGVRRVMNYGHSFGHAIESATDFGVPHGIAVSIGMDMANWTAAALGLSTWDHFDRMHGALARNFRGFARVDIPLDRLLSAMGKDKKNTGGQLVLILPDREGRVGITTVNNDETFARHCADYLARRAS